MASTYPLTDATAEDAPAIASLFALSWTSPFTQLQFGKVDPSSFAKVTAPRIAEHMKKDHVRFVMIREPETQDVVAVAQWTLPKQEASETAQETEAEKEERQQLEDEVYRKRLPDNSNKDLIMEFTGGLRKLREQTLRGRRHFVLENIATHPDYRGKGFASRLIKWVFPQADEQGVLVYLDTASDNNAKRLYESLGFEEKGSNTIEDLSKFGGEGSETHVALIRYPSSNS